MNFFPAGSLQEYAPVEAVYIYFGTATFDEIERDVKVKIWVSFGYNLCYECEILKVTLEAQLGLIGGTMGLLTGFSILSGVEIIYYVVR